MSKTSKHLLFRAPGIQKSLGNINTLEDEGEKM
jgi:hypothetical protein